VLGPLVVVDGDATVEGSSAVVRRLLAGLLCRAGEVVSIATLAEAVWPDGPPQTREAYADVSTVRWSARLRRA
jgi:hypothetical protein